MESIQVDLVHSEYGGEFVIPPYTPGGIMDGLLIRWELIAYCVWDGDVGLGNSSLAQYIPSGRCHPSR